MSLFLLDSDIITLFQQRHATVMTKVAAARQAHQVAVSAITIDESYGGWHARFRKARKQDELSDAYAGLAQAAAVFGAFSILPFPVPAIQRFGALKRLKLNVGPNDLRTVAVALVVGAMVVTRNLRGFRRVPGLDSEDWSV